MRHIPPNAGLWQARLVPKMLIELTICSAISPPKTHWVFDYEEGNGRLTYSLDSFMNIIGLLKSYQVLRLYWHYCSWNQQKV